jgi:hypothetical protein
MEHNSHHTTHFVGRNEIADYHAEQRVTIRALYYDNCQMQFTGKENRLFTLPGSLTTELVPELN